MPPHPVDLPALLGGPAIRPGGPPAWPRSTPAVEAALESAFASGAWGHYRGPNVPAFELDLLRFHGVPEVLTCASGTLAVEAALRALSVGPGDEVILAAYEFESTFLTLHAIGAKPVLIDVHAQNWNLDPAKIEAAITPATKAIICSHLHGGIVPIREIMEIAAKHNLRVVEDAAQATGATVQGKPAGTWGDVGTLSFGGSKLLSAGRGGAILTGGRFHHHAKLWLARGIQQWAALSELQAAVLRPQLAELPAANAHRAVNVARILAGIAEKEVQGLVPFVNSVPASTPAFYKVGFQFDEAAFGLPRDLFVRALRAEGIAFDEGFRALHVNRSPSRFVVAGDLHEATRAHHGCVILHHPILLGTPEDADQVANAIAKTYRNRDRLRAAV